MGSNALSNRCPSCGAPIGYTPSAGSWVCKYCDNKFSLEELQKRNNASSEKVNLGSEGSDTQYDSYNCKECGAEIIADENTSATFCMFCGNTAILKSKLSGKFAPNQLIPFKKDKDCAIENFKKLGKGRPFIPKEFLDKKNIEKITGLYIPFWLFDLNMGGALSARATKVQRWTTGDMHFTKTDTYNLIRDGSMQFNKIPVDGSIRFDDKIMNTLEPFDYNDLVDYNHAFLAGFFSEKYDIDSEKSFDAAYNRALNSATDTMRSSMRGYASVNITENTIGTRNTSVSYVLLPVWMVNVKYKKELYLFAMNGQTGQFVGDVPIDKRKVVIYSIGLFLIVFTVFMVVSYIVQVVGN